MNVPYRTLAVRSVDDEAKLSQPPRKLTSQCHSGPIGVDDDFRLGEILHGARPSGLLHSEFAGGSVRKVCANCGDLPQRSNVSILFTRCWKKRVRKVYAKRANLPHKRANLPQGGGIFVMGGRIPGEKHLAWTIILIFVSKQIDSSIAFMPMIAEADRK